MIHDPSLRLQNIILRKPAEQRQIQGEVKEVSRAPGLLKQTKVEFEKRMNVTFFFWDQKNTYIYDIYVS